MPAMGAMDEMRGAVPVAPAGAGRVRGDLALPMEGPWTLEVTVAAGARRAGVDFRFRTGESGLTASPRALDAAAGAVQIAPARRAFAGFRTAPVVRAPMTLSIRAVGRVTYDERRLTDVTLKLRGSITHLDVATTGTRVTRGQRLLTLYSPELYAAQEEYLAALASPGRDALAAAAARKLALWGQTPAQIAELARRGTALEDVAIVAPAGGTVIEKDVVEGAAVEAGQRLFRLAALDQVWVEAELFEGDLARVHVGQRATVTLSYVAGPPIEGKVAFVYPYLDPTSRTAGSGCARQQGRRAQAGDVRERGARRRPRPAPPGPGLAVVFTGPRRLVFVDAGADTLRPVEVELGARSDDAVEIVSGLAEGDQVVVAGEFLVAAESRLRSSALWSAPRGPDAHP